MTGETRWGAAAHQVAGHADVFHDVGGDQEADVVLERVVGRVEDGAERRVGDVREDGQVELQAADGKGQGSGQGLVSKRLGSEQAGRFGGFATGVLSAAVRHACTGLQRNPQSNARPPSTASANYRCRTLLIPV